MPQKVRVKAPKQRASTPSRQPRNRQLLVGAAGLIAGFAVVALAIAMLGLGGGDPSPEDVRADLTAAGCTLQAVKAQPGRHSLGPDDTAKWNTDPPTNGPHFGFDQNALQGTAVWGAYTEPVQLARLVHNLEHGGIYILYGDDVPAAQIEQVNAFYDDHRRGTVLAPYSKLGDKIALGAWVADEEQAMGYLAKCPSFEDDAFSAFFDGFQFKGPERVPESALLPGGN